MEENLKNANAALKAISEIQTNTSISYGLGVKYSLAGRLDVRADFRQYLVLSVTGMVKDELEEEVLGNLPQETQGAIGQVQVPKEKDRTVQYNELSIGVNFKF